MLPRTTTDAQIYGLVRKMAKSFEGWMSSETDWCDLYGLPEDSDYEAIARAMLTRDDFQVDPEFDLRWQAEAWLAYNCKLIDQK